MPFPAFQENAFQNLGAHGTKGFQVSSSTPPISGGGPYQMIHHHHHCHGAWLLAALLLEWFR